MKVGNSRACLRNEKDRNQLSNKVSVMLGSISPVCSTAQSNTLWANTERERLAEVNPPVQLIRGVKLNGDKRKRR